jgi:hypothetical protein
VCARVPNSLFLGFGIVIIEEETDRREKEKNFDDTLPVEPTILLFWCQLPPSSKLQP